METYRDKEKEKAYKDRYHKLYRHYYKEYRSILRMLNMYRDAFDLYGENTHYRRLITYKKIFDLYQAFKDWSVAYHMCHPNSPKQVVKRIDYEYKELEETLHSLGLPNYVNAKIKYNRLKLRTGVK